MKVEEIESIQCPVCGYYCLGHGGHGCIDKPSMVKDSEISRPQSELAEAKKEIERLKSTNKELVNINVEMDAILDSITSICEGKEVSDFMLSFSVVSKVDDLRARIKELEGKLEPIEEILTCGECNIDAGVICSMCAQSIKQAKGER
jgi:DNA repair exonuclease SbcCD ATPase subunit